MSPPALTTHSEPSGFPRVSGDEPASIKTHEAFLLFSPRERG